MISLQQLLALIIIAILIYRLISQKRKKQINGNEFTLWLIFWLGAGLAILFLKELDMIAANLGFSASGINLLFYAGTLALFYAIFKLRLHLAKLDRDLTNLNRELTIMRKKD